MTKKIKPMNPTKTSNYQPTLSHIVHEGLLLHLLGFTNFPAMLNLTMPEAQARMEDIQDANGNGDHDALEPDEEVLPAHQFPGPAAAELRDPEDAPPEDADRAERERAEERPEHLGAPEPHQPRVLVERRVAERPPPPRRVGEEVHAERHEDQQREHLERQPRDHDVVPRVRRFLVVERHRGHRAAGCLEDEGDDVAGDELGFKR